MQFTKEQIQLAGAVAAALGQSCKLIEDDDQVLDFGNHDITPLDDGKFLVCQTSFVPGVRYTTNGDGIPDDVDVKEIASHDKFKNALTQVMTRTAEQMVDAIIAQQAEEDLDAAYFAEAMDYMMTEGGEG